MTQKIHLRERGTDRAVCNKLATYYSVPVLTNAKRQVTCERCEVVIKARMRKLVRGFE